MLYLKKISSLCVILCVFFLIDVTVSAQCADARSRMGGRMFSRPLPQKAPTQHNMKNTNQGTGQNKGGFGRGVAGGLLGGALGALLFGSLFGAAGQGGGILPLLLLAGVGYFIFRRIRSGAGQHAGGGSSGVSAMSGHPSEQENDKESRLQYLTPVERGLEEIKQSDAHFDRAHFVEVASDVFFQVQAGWMRRDLESYKHLLGKRLAGEYDEHFAKMRQDGHINKLESIAIRKVEVVDAGSDGNEDFVKVLFTANLLDYTVDEKSGDVVDGSTTTPVKFAEEWTWARPSGTNNWLLEGIEVVNG